MSGIAQTSIYLTLEDRVLLRELQERTGLSRSAVFRLALQKMHGEDADRQVRLLEIAEELRRLS